jgi:hypothetical protein
LVKPWVPALAWLDRAVRLAIRMEYPEKATLRTDTNSLISKGWHDLP